MKRSCSLAIALCIAWITAGAGAPAASAQNAAPRVSDTGRIDIPPMSAPARQFFVAPDGAEDNPGDESKPFASLERARDAIRSLRQQGALPDGGVAVVVRGGRYPVSATLTLTAEDSGSAQAPITYAAREGEMPIFSGGIQLSGFEPVQDPGILARLPEEARSQVMQVDLKPLGVKPLPPLILGGMASGNGFVTHPVAELFFNGKPMTMARYPNEGMMRTADISLPDGHTIHGLTGSKTGQIIYDGERPARWTNEKDAMLYGYWFFDWADSYERIAAIDPQKHQISFATPYHGYGYRKGARFYAVNLLAEIDQPGEWYLDRENSIVYFYPPADPKQAVIELSLLDTPMLRLENSAHLRFERITWELSAGDAIQAENSSRCLFAGCTVRRCGGDGIVINGGAEQGVWSCDIYSMGRGGVVIRGGDRKSLTPGNHFVENCHIYELSRIDHTYTPAALIGGVGNRVAHNLMHHINSSAIRMDGNDHCVEFNEVYDALLESDDQGGADMFGDPTFRGNVFRYNYWHHLGNWRQTGEMLSCGQAGIRLDDAISGVLIFGNIFHRCASGKLGFGGVQIHGGKDNCVENNIFAECSAAISFSPWGEDRWKKFIEKSMAAPAIDAALYQQRYPLLAQLAEAVDVNEIRNNLVWKCSQFLLRENGRNNIADNIITENPAVFADPARGDFSVNLQTDPLKASKFTPIPFAEIGLYTNPFRPTLPLDQIAQARAQQP